MLSGSIVCEVLGIPPNFARPLRRSDVLGPWQDGDGRRVSLAGLCLEKTTSLVGLTHN
jgi:hypothetical protein